MKLNKKISRIVSLVSAVVMVMLFTVNAFADTIDVTYKSYYSSTSYMQNEADKYNVEFTMYMKPVVRFSNDNTPAEIVGVYAYVTIEWNKAEALPKPNKNAKIKLYIVQSYQPEKHYSTQETTIDLGSVEIDSLLDKSVRTSTGYKYTSKTFYSKAVPSSAITSYDPEFPKCYNSDGFLYWRTFEVKAEMSSSTVNEDYTAGTFALEDYTTIIDDCRNQL